MKNFYLIITFCLGWAFTFAQVGGADCAQADLFPVTLPYSGSAESTCGFKNDYDSTNVPQCGNKLFMRAEDKLYKFVPGISGTILVFLSNPTDDSISVFVFQGCPLGGGVCIASNTTSSPNKNIAFTVSAGATYYVMIDRGDQPGLLTNCVATYSITISEPDPACPKLLTAPPNFAPNLDFEQGNFNKWKTFAGTCCPINVVASGVIPGRHTIMSGAGKDPNTGNVVTVVAPGGGKRSARLGNPVTGAQGERLSYKFKVTPQTNGIIYRYAIVLEDAGHGEPEQPRFEVRVADAAGNTVPCGFYKVAAGPGIPCFQAFGGYFFKDWTTVGIDLNSYMGQDIIIEYSTGDCSQGGHFGYGYLDVAATKLQIELLDGNLCQGDSSITLKAPDGFDGYLWSNGATTQTTTIKGLKPGDSVKVTLTPVQGFLCTSTLITVIPQSSTLNANFTSTDNKCNSDVFYFTDLSQFTPVDAIITNWYWDFGDGTTSTTQNPEHIFSSGGSYNVSLVVKNNAGCTDTLVKTITVIQGLAQPLPFCKSATTNSIEFGWNPIATATAYEISIDGGQTWNAPSSGSAGTNHIITGLLPNEAITLYLRALGPPPCDTSFISDPVTCVSNGCNEIQSWLSLGVDSLAEGDTTTIQVTVSGGSGSFGYTWSPDIGSYAGPYEINPEVTTTYTVIITDLLTQGCPPDTVSITLPVYCPGISNLSISGDPVISLGQSTSIRATITGGRGPFVYTWNPDIGNGPGPHTVTPSVPTLYTLSVQDQGKSGCPGAADSFYVNVIGTEDAFFNIPNAFSPNGDGHNDGFKGEGKGVTDYNLKVYNRWGEVVFNTKNLDESWNGHKNNDQGGVRSPVGVYIYIVKVRLLEGPIKTYYGTVSLTDTKE